MTEGSSSVGIVGFVRNGLGKSAWIIPAGLLATLALAFGAALLTSPSYTTSKQVLFLAPPVTGDDVTALNPFLSFTGSINTAAEVISLTVTDGRTGERIAPKGSGIEYEVSAAPMTATPALTIEVAAPTKAKADAVANTLVDLMATNLAAQQSAAKAPKDTWVTSRLIAADAEPERDLTNQIAAFIVATAVGLLGTACAAILVIRRNGKKDSKRPLETVEAGSRNG